MKEGCLEMGCMVLGFGNLSFLAHFVNYVTPNSWSKNDSQQNHGPKPSVLAFHKKLAKVGDRTIVKFSSFHFNYFQLDFP